MPELIHEHTFRIHSYEVGPTGEARPTTLFNFLQEAAGEHAASWGVSVPDLLPRGRTWVLSRYRLRVDRYPRLYDELTVRTWPSARGGRFAVRDFELLGSAGGAPLAVATTSWMVLDVRTGKPLPIEEFVPARFVLPRRALEDPFDSLPKLDAAERELTFRVMVRDLDMNRHVNNAVYVQWALEAAPPEVHERARPIDIEISYRAMAYHGEEIVSRLARAGSPVAAGGSTSAGAAANAAAQGDAVFLHQVANAATGVELARARSTWREHDAGVMP